MASKLLFNNPAFLRNLLKPVVVNFLNFITLGRGITVNIGGQGEFKMSPQFYFSVWENWGDNRNRAYLFAFFAVVAIFMFFFKRNFRRKMEERNKNQ
mgnify:CR=1 FL=1